jgi:hypothetical protein
MNTGKRKGRGYFDAAALSLYLRPSPLLEVRLEPLFGGGRKSPLGSSKALEKKGGALIPMGNSITSVGLPLFAQLWPR